MTLLNADQRQYEIRLTGIDAPEKKMRFGQRPRERKRSANPSCAVADGVLKRVLRGDRRECRRCRGGVVGRAPVMRQQLREIAVLERGQTLEHVLEVGPGVVPIEFG